MKTNKAKVLAMRRKREGRTDYRLRLRLLKSQTPRLVVRRSLKNVTAQVVMYQPKGDQVVLCAESRELKQYGWEGATRNTPGAYLTGYLIAMKAKKKNIKEAILDVGLYKATKGNIFFALAKGAVDAGLVVPLSGEIAPSEDRIKGKHLKHPGQFEKVLQNIKTKVKE